MRGARAAAGQHVDLVEDLHGADQRQDDDDEQVRHEQRQGDAPEDAAGPGAVHLGGLVEVARDRLQAGEQDEGVEAHMRPDRHADGGGEGPEPRSVSQSIGLEAETDRARS